MLLGADHQSEQRVPKLVRHFHTGLQVAVDTLQDLASRDRRFFPSGGVVWQLLALFCVRSW
jgi:hypothetical protein